MKKINMIIGALSTGAKALAENTRDRDIEDAYAELKELIRDRFTDKGKSEGKIALKKFEEKPDGVWEGPLKESLAETGSDEDENILDAAEKLIMLDDPAQMATGVFDIGDHGVEEADPDGRIAARGALGNEPPTSVRPASGLGRYLSHVISRCRHLRLRGIRSSGRMLHLELDRIYITLRSAPTRESRDESQWLAEQSAPANGETDRARGPAPAIKDAVSVNQALSDHHRLVVLGDPGSGKTTFLRYLALLYARDMAENTLMVAEKLGLDESGSLPILLPLREIADFLTEHGFSEDDDVERDALVKLLLHFFKSERVELSDDFFVQWLTSGKAAIFLDGLDEVANLSLRNRVSRLVEAFARAFPRCRYVVASRIVGYIGQAKLGEEFKTTAVRDFSMSDIERFLKSWHRMLAIARMGPGESAETYAAKQTRRLLDAIRDNERIRELAINPLMLTVIAVVHRDRVKLPDRRAELYAEAVDVLLGKWDEARGVKEMSIFKARPFDTGDKRLALQRVALAMHENQRKEIGAEKLRRLLIDLFEPNLNDVREAEGAARRFMNVIEQRSGLLNARGTGVYAFSHLTFQEYLAALAVAAKDGYVKYTLARVHDRWWREVFLLEAGYLSTQSKERVTRLIRAIANLRDKSEPYYNLVMAAECIRDVGANRVEGGLEREIQRELRKGLEKPPGLLSRVFKKFSLKGWIERRSVVMNALVRAGAGYWKPPFGEPEWREVPAGPFWLGGGAENVHQVYLDGYAIGLTPVTNSQYHLFIKSAGREPPDHWADGRPPRGAESHPATNVSWLDAMAYCKWLSMATAKAITLPTEAQWEKAARGDKDRRLYPWGDDFNPTYCNTYELGNKEATPVGIFREAESPYGCLDMVGNVWEWCLDWYGEYAPGPVSNPAGPSSGAHKVMRGGCWLNSAKYCRADIRIKDVPAHHDLIIGFRVAKRLNP
ncbi:MAG: SUMF1/EgtB/PvdO family nonheme iron enzyme [Desulfobacterales bacterium]|nr:SUMF1/EgtB/PvdO family nonheme iron enzyme [Desulfobacterales bacterium]